MEIKLEDGTVFKRDFDEFTDKIQHPKYKTCQHVATFKGKRYFLCRCRVCKSKHMLCLDEMKDFECNKV